MHGGKKRRSHNMASFSEIGCFQRWKAKEQIIGVNCEMQVDEISFSRSYFIPYMDFHVISIPVFNVYRGTYVCISKRTVTIITDIR